MVTLSGEEMVRIGASFKDKDSAAYFADFARSNVRKGVSSVSSRARNSQGKYIVDAEVNDEFLEDFRQSIREHKGEILENEYLEALVDLYKGKRDPYVSHAKSLLHDKEYYSGNIFDDFFDEELTKAIRAFQQDNALPPTGVIDSKTWMLLHK
jgi:murein L,D-transpeptidase YcbB/YkuD